jgi:hypothetical protein
MSIDLKKLLLKRKERQGYERYDRERTNNQSGS